MNAAQPGLKIAFARAQLLQQFPDAFMPFTQCGCTLTEKYMGEDRGASGGPSWMEGGWKGV